MKADGWRRLVAVLAGLAVWAAGAAAWGQGTGRDFSVEAMRAEKRVALVIGNGAYDASPLRNPVNDARAMAGALRGLGFDVSALENVTQRDLRLAIIRFGDRLRGGGVGLFFFAGHGVQVTGKNFMIPIGAAIASEAEVEVESVDVASVLARMETAQNRVNIVILDACRDNPFGRSFRTASRGLASIDAPSGTLIAYATAPGKTAADGESQNSPYTAELLKAMRTPGLKVEDVFKRVRQAVQQQTRRQQVPWEASSLVGDFLFVPPAPGGGAPSPGPVAVAPSPQAPVPTVKVVPRLGSLVVRSTRESVDVWLGERHLGQAGPGADLLVESLQVGTHNVRARARRDGFKPWDREVPVAPDQRAEVAIDIEPLAPPKVIKGSDDRAEMVLIPAGQFWMGSDDADSDEKPRHRVHLDAYYIDKFELTNGQYRRCVQAGSCREPEWNEPGNTYNASTGTNDLYRKLGSALTAADHPVVGVSWNDAEAYCKWAGKRLPTEAEWEKAARGTDGRKFPWGEAWQQSRTNSAESGTGKPVAVGSYPSGASPYGVHDMAGNVWEWVADWYDGSYYQRSPEKNPQGPSSGNSKVLRGGSWNYDPILLRAAYRYYFTPDYRFSYIGFRCARGLP